MPQQATAPNDTTRNNAADADQKLLTELIAAEGNLQLAAERLNTTTADLLRRLANSPTILPGIGNLLRGLLAVNVFQLLMETQLALRASLSDLQPHVLAKTHTSLITAFAQLANPTPSATNEADEDLVELTREALEGKLDELSARRRTHKLAPHAITPVDDGDGGSNGIETGT